MNNTKKTVKIYSGTDLALCSPSHPLSAAMQAKRVIDRIDDSDDTRFEFSCNTPDAICVWECYGRQKKGLNVVYYLNGKQASYDEVISDTRDRSAAFVKELISKIKC
jgi:hypothetical protein